MIDSNAIYAQQVDGYELRYALDMAAFAEQGDTTETCFLCGATERIACVKPEVWQCAGLAGCMARRREAK